MKDPETLIQPTMGIKWNSGSLLDMEAHMPSATQNNSKGTKRNNQERRNILNHNGQRKIYNSIHKPQRSPTKRWGLIRMTTNTKCAMKQEFLNSWNLQIPGIPMVMMVTSCSRSQRDPTQQDFINARTLPIYKCHTRFKF